MKYCANCGEELLDGIKFCPNCGVKIESNNAKEAKDPRFDYDADNNGYKDLKDNTYTYDSNDNSNDDITKMESPTKAIAFIFMIVGMVTSLMTGVLAIALAWQIPMTIHYYKKMKNKEEVSTGFMVCTLLFLSFISGVLLLVDKNQNKK